MYIYIYIYIPKKASPLVCSLTTAGQTAYGYYVSIDIPTPRGETGANNVR